MHANEFRERTLIGMHIVNYSDIWYVAVVY